MVQSLPLVGAVQKSSSSSWLARASSPGEPFSFWFHGGPLKRPVAGSWVRSRPRQRGWASQRLASSGVIGRLDRNGLDPACRDGSAHRSRGDAERLGDLCRPGIR